MRHACGDDHGLRAELLCLLAAHDAAEEYFDDLSERLLAPALSGVALSESGASPDLVPRLQAKLAGSYGLERELGGGGMSRVFVAEDLKLRRHVVLKVLPSEMVPAAGSEQFQREIELLAPLQHPHIVPLLTADVADGFPYYTMPLVTGESLRDRLSRDGPIPIEEAVRIWRDVLDALAYAHASGIIHRDIKPGNILLSGRHALVTDFGIADAIESAGTDALEVRARPTFGTAAYLAPEQATEGHRVDPRIDIYQAGLVMYEMLTGRLPFDQAHLTGSDAPADLVALILRCLATDPARRPHRVDLLVKDLEPLATTVTPPKPEGQEERERHPWWPAALGGAAIALGAMAFAWLTALPQAGEPLRGDAQRFMPEIAAHEWYERGMDLALLRTDSGRHRAVEYFARAVALDSNYAAAQAGVARTYVSIWNSAPVGERRTWMARADEAALRAISLDDANPDALAALGWVRLASRSYETAAGAFARALRLNPDVYRGHEGLARVYMMLGRHADQLAEARLAVEVDPLSHSAVRELALALATNGRCEDAFERLRPLKSLSPPATVAGVLSGQCHASRGRWSEAVAEFRWAAETSADAGSFAPAFLGFALARAGRQSEAADILGQLLSGTVESHGAFGIATVFAGMGDYDQAFAWLDRAVDEDTLNPYIMHPMFADLHRDRRFAHVKERIGLPT